MQEGLEKALINIWRQLLVEDARTVEVEGRSYPAKQTPRHHLREVDFVFDGESLRGLEQNPNTSSRWAQMAREGKKVM